MAHRNVFERAKNEVGTGRREALVLAAVLDDADLTGADTVMSREQMRQWAPRIQARTVDTHDMPFMNKTGMLDEERTLLGQWIANGAQTGFSEGKN